MPARVKIHVADLPRYFVRVVLFNAKPPQVLCCSRGAGPGSSGVNSTRGVCEENVSRDMGVVLLNCCCCYQK